MPTDINELLVSDEWRERIRRIRDKRMEIENATRTVCERCQFEITHHLAYPEHKCPEGS